MNYLLLGMYGAAWFACAGVYLAFQFLADCAEAARFWLTDRLLGLDL